MVVRIDRSLNNNHKGAYGDIEEDIPEEIFDDEPALLEQLIDFSKGSKTMQSIETKVDI